LVNEHRDRSARAAAIEQAGAVQGRQLAELGVNLNFAPVVDLDHDVTNPNDRYTRIHDRAISADPRVVLDVADRYCSALQTAGVRCTLKHFPGLGRVFEDTHLESALLATPPGELAATDWVPFRALAQHPNAIMMLGHARLATIDRERPASFSPGVVNDLLRGEWKYDGVLVTDDFTMGAVYRSHAGLREAGIGALNAGVDLILASFDPDQYYVVMHALLGAYRTGRIDDQSLERSERRLAAAALELPQP
jgi:beta-N-acetylhexosaminidase